MSGFVAKRNVDYLKPPNFKNYLTLSELAMRTDRDPSWLRVLEKDGRIPKAQRVKRGKIKIRLWSPEQADEICEIIAQHRPGRPRND